MINGSLEIEKQVLNSITPNSKERKELDQVIKELKDVVQKKIEDTNLPITSELVGSISKDTYLRNNLDIDLFLLFPTNVSREDLQEHGLSIGRAILKDREECFAEHPYVRGYFNSYKTEIVPCYKIESSSQKLSAVDRTPLHTKYVMEYLKESQKREVRLFKQFLRGIGCYGAEAEVEGFSGYLCEILILRYDNFQNLIINAQNWKHAEQLSLTELEAPTFDTTLVFIDPVDKERNVSSALSKEKFDLFTKACKEYVKKPSITFFFPNEVKLWSIDKIRGEIDKRIFIGIKIEKPDVIVENLYPQVRKAVRSIRDLCKRFDFIILETKFHVDDKAIYIILHPEKRKLSKTTIHKGPPVRLKEYTHDFIQKWTNNSRTISKPFEEDKRLYVEVKREYIDIKDLLVKNIKTLSLGKDIDERVRKEFIILKQEELVIENLRGFWTEYLDGKMPWER